MRIETVKVVVRVTDNEANRKAFKPSPSIVDGSFQYYGEKIVARDDDEKIIEGRHAGKDVKIQEDVDMNGSCVNLIDWDNQTRLKYGKGIVYMANYGIDLSERSRVQGENRLSQAKPNTKALAQAFFSEKLLADPVFLLEVRGRMAKGQTMDAIAMDAYAKANPIGE